MEEELPEIAALTINFSPLHFTFHPYAWKNRVENIDGHMGAVAPFNPFHLACLVLLLAPNVDMGANFSTMNLSKFSKRIGFLSVKFTILCKFLYSIANFAWKILLYPHIAIFFENQTR